MLLPFSNRITGPIEPQDPLCLNATSNSSSSIFSGSGSGSGSGVFENATDTNSTAYCEIDDVIGVNENSIKRVPISVWLILLAVMCLLVISRLVNESVPIFHEGYSMFCITLSVHDVYISFFSGSVDLLACSY